MINLHLDVDGVVNAQYPQWGDEVSSGVATSNGINWTIRWSQNMVNELASLPVSLIWTTTWTHEAPTEIAPLIGWGEDGSVLYPRQEADYNPWRDSSIVWKYDAMRAMYPGDQHQFIWLDDELSSEEIAWAESVGGLAICIDPERGISPQDMHRMWDYVENNL